ncbi:unnamed protein product [Gordionus sp. m RMFG-2023]
MPYHCNIPVNASINDWIPHKTHDSDPANYESNGIIYSSCDMFSTNKTVVPCSNGWYYVRREESIIAEWDLVCRLDYLVPLAASVFMGGSVPGAIIFSILSDKYGRRYMLFYSTSFYSISTILSSFAPRYFIFVTLRFIQGIMHAGTFVIHIVILTELLPKEKRYLIPILATLCMSIGCPLLALVSFMIPAWRNLQLVAGLMLALYVLSTFFLDESIYWLADNGYSHRAKSLIIKAAKWNKCQLPPDFERVSIEVYSKNHEKDGGLTGYKPKIEYEDSELKSEPRIAVFKDLFTHPELRRRNLLIAFGTFFMSQVYMGLTFTTNVLPGSIYVNFTLIGLTELPGKLLSLFAIKIGRRKPIFLLNSLSALFLCCQIFLPLFEESNGKDILNIILFMTSRSLIGGSIAIIFVLISEVFPTSVRNTGYGLNNSLTRLGFLISPFVFYLQNINVVLLPLVMAGLNMLSAVLISLLPPTKGIPLPESLDDLDKDTYRLQPTCCYLFPKYGDQHSLPNTPNQSRRPFIEDEKPKQVTSFSSEEINNSLRQGQNSISDNSRQPVSYTGADGFEEGERDEPGNNKETNI